MRPGVGPMRGDEGVATGKNSGASAALSAYEVFAKLMQFQGTIDDTNREIKGVKELMQKLVDAQDETHARLDALRETTEAVNSQNVEAVTTIVDSTTKVTEQAQKVIEQNSEAVQSIKDIADELKDRGDALGQMLWARLRQENDAVERGRSES